MKFGQLKEYNVRNIQSQNVMEKLVPDPFMEN